MPAVVPPYGAARFSLLFMAVVLYLAPVVHATPPQRVDSPVTRVSPDAVAPVTGIEAPVRVESSVVVAPELAPIRLVSFVPRALVPAPINPQFTPQKFRADAAITQETATRMAGFNLTVPPSATPHHPDSLIPYKELAEKKTKKEEQKKTEKGPVVVSKKMTTAKTKARKVQVASLAPTKIPRPRIKKQRAIKGAVTLDKATTQFRSFAEAWVDKANRNYQFSRSRAQIEQVGNEFIARFLEVEPNSLDINVKESKSKTTPYVGIMRYVERIMEARGSSKKLALKGDFKPAKRKRITEIFSYTSSQKRWKY